MTDYTEEEYLNLGASFEETEKRSIKANTEIFIIENNKEQDEETLSKDIITLRKLYYKENSK